ncbi:glycoside hydrolase family 9 protein [Arcticibacter eurypsychrophilus]|uniref:glycoside hydrolase family 9 protein n=1 Tax=Arcticibacter eurypsychrophilus TaxID=1434752 RepID=UPI00084D999E|nr:glycoside hydrolase family 9 protein [Arcticibacter eurypsychrophilus]
MKFRISFLFIPLILMIWTTLYAQTDLIKLNQLGFYNKAPKFAFITGTLPASQFYIVSKLGKDTVFRSTLGPVSKSAYSETQTRMVDFSTLQQSGIFVLVVPGIGSSYPFTIGKNVNQHAAIATLKGFYYQRVSMPLDLQYAGKWNRPAGHPDTRVLIHPSAASAQRPAGTVIASPGGWYDAGDYNKYIVNSGITMGTLLSAYEDFPHYFDTLKTNIPESGNRLPDQLDEVLYNLRWMLTMQDPNDGGVYNKCTNAAFDGMVMPGVTKAPRFVVQKGTAATLGFAAVAAQAARILKKYPTELPGLSDSCLKASTMAWEWALKNPNMEYNQTLINSKYKPQISTGGYGDKAFSDEWFWAASELYCSTGDKRYETNIKDGLQKRITVPSWANVSALGWYSLLRNKTALPPLLKEQIDSAGLEIIRIADKFIENERLNAFKTVMGQSARDFNWGGNSVAANQGILLINAYLLTHNKKYVDHALTNLDYILGRNATGYCFVTGIGSKSVKHPHHRQSVADKIADPVPGLMSGGPNPGMQDVKTVCTYPEKAPELAYIDRDCSYASNEIAINWNAPIVYLSNAIEALQSEIGY